MFIREEVVKSFIAESGLQFGAASFRRTLAGEANSPTTQYALYAWLARVIQKARSKKSTLGVFDKSILSAGFLRELAQLSWSDRGPLLAVEYLEKHGIAVVIEPHLKGTLLDGAALNDIDGMGYKNLTSKLDLSDGEIINIPAYFLEVDDLAHLLHVTNSSSLPILEKAIKLVYIFKSQDEKMISYKNNSPALMILGVRTH